MTVLVHWLPSWHGGRWGGALSLHMLSGSCAAVWLPRGSDHLRGLLGSLNTGACRAPESQREAKFLDTPCLQVENSFFFFF